MKMVLLNLSRHLLPKHLHTWGNRKHVMNAVVTRNRELISRSGSHVRAADGVARGGDPPRHSVFFFAKSVTFRGVFFIDVICVQKVSRYHPLFICGPDFYFLSPTSAPQLAAHPHPTGGGGGAMNSHLKNRMYIEEGWMIIVKYAPPENDP